MAIIDFDRYDDLPEDEICGVTSSKFLNMLDARKNSHPDLSAFLTQLGNEQTEVIAFLENNVSDGKANVVGGIAFAFLGYQIRKICGFYQVVGNLQYFPVDDLLASARRDQKYRDLKFDLDIVRPNIDSSVLGTTDLPNCKIKTDPNRVCFGDGYSISITEDSPEDLQNVRSLNNLHTSLDEIRLPIDSGMNIQVIPNLLTQELKLELKGDLQKAFRETDDSQIRFISIVILRFIAQTLLTRDGKQITVNFGKNKKEDHLLLALMLKSMAYIMTHKEADRGLYDWFLDIINPNFPLFDNRIQKVIDLAEMYN